ncbi:hypothetical protein DAETH_07580 [Deinococcus aetherius]|uniref:Uncharacterized protein n=2 Tax=Deinococcus aetherius TaxID=200252 RepID=A0ABM8AAL0_9DEIO|nr:hypothetical protein DAETH_07580 [Deinococcus aetherius]
MTRWASLARHPERPWLIWDPDRWLLPVPWEGVALLVALGMVAPGVVWLLLGGRRSSSIVIAAGFVWALVSARLTFLWRRHLRRQRARQARSNDWVCAACLYTEAST